LKLILEYGMMEVRIVGEEEIIFLMETPTMTMQVQAE